MTTTPSTDYKLPDVLKDGLRAVFCGTAASTVSAQRGAYYAGPGNRFWPTLHQVGITPGLFRPEEFARLLDLGLGLTDLAKGAAGMDAQIPSLHYDVPAFWSKMRVFRPRLVVFTSKTAARLALERKHVDYGWTGESLPVFVLPSPSGAARGSWDEAWWRDLAELLRS